MGLGRGLAHLPGGCWCQDAALPGPHCPHSEPIFCQPLLGYCPGQTRQCGLLAVMSHLSPALINPLLSNFQGSPCWQSQGPARVGVAPDLQEGSELLQEGCLKHLLPHRVLGSPPPTCSSMLAIPEHWGTPRSTGSAEAQSPQSAQGFRCLEPDPSGWGCGGWCPKDWLSSMAGVVVMIC